MTDEQREAIEAGAKTMEWVATMPNSAMLRYAIVLRSMLTTRPAPSPTDAAWTEPCNQCGGFGGHEEGCTGHKAPSPSREGWLERGSIEKWRTSFKVCYTALGHAELDALCDMALSALRPAEAKACCEAECYGCGLKYSTHAHNSCPKCGSILRTAHIETGKRRALRPAAGGEK